MKCQILHNRIILTFLILVLWNVIVISQDLHFEQYTEVHGLPSMMTYQMAQDSNGILWIGTENGLVSYDGEDFQRYTHPELLSNDIVQIALDKTGRVYFSNLLHQFAFVERDKVHIINTDSLGGNVIDIAITETKNYVTTDAGVKEFSEIKEGQFNFRSSDNNNFLFDNNIYTPCRYYQKSLKLDSLKIIFQSEFISKLISGSVDGRYFYIGYPNFLVEMDSVVNALIGDKDYKRVIKYLEKTFVILEKGILIYDATTGEYFTFLKDITANTVFIDKESNIWISTPNEGLIKIPYSDFQFGSKNHDFVKNFGVSDLILDVNGHIYIGTTTGQFLHYNKSKELIHNVNISPRFKPVTLYVDNNKIYGKAGSNIFIFDKNINKIKVLENKTSGLKSFLVENNTFYVGTRSGIYSINSNDFQNNKTPIIRSLQGLWITSIYMDTLSESLYFGSTTGLHKASKSDLSKAIEITGLKDQHISCIIGGDQNSMWVGTKNNGAIKLRAGGIVENFNTSNGLVSDNVNAIKISNGKLIVSTIKGVSIKDINTGEIQTISELSRIVPKEVLFCNNFGDEYWLGSNLGLSIVHKDQLQYFGNNGPTLSLKNMYANGKEIFFEDNLQFSHRVSSILINFRNVSLQNGINKSIKYRVSGADTSWVYSSDPLIRLQALKYGNYSIEAVGLNELKEEGNKVSLNFTINPPWWQTMWARIIGGLLVIGFFQLIIRARSKRIRREEATKRDYLSQINNIKDQALQLQMNPHFIFNSLNAIQGFIGTDEEEMAMNYLARFARLIRLIFEHSKGNTITLEEELEFIHLYLDLEKLRFKEKVNITINVDPQLQDIKDIIKIPPLLIQPMVENSFKHGLFHKKGKGNLNIDYTLRNKVIQVVIQDDGIGRVQSRMISRRNSEKQISSGIKTTKERIDLLNFGKKEKYNKIEIEDIYNEDGSSNGTKIKIELSVV